ncbi:MAG TPA: acyltransferase [Polyangiaceae bacterium]|nr:acyltransferase [Polyangiaceae bacterium]
MTPAPPALPATPASATPAPDRHAEFLGRRYFPALDGLRGLAILAVLWHHALPRPESGWIGRGHVGVRLFFALSGFLITARLLAERRATGEVALGRFWMRRALRIFPLYYAVLALFALYLGQRPGAAGSAHFFDNLLFHASYTSNWFVDYQVPHPVWFAFGWSLATEEQFYAWWPPLASALRRSTAMLVLLAVLALQQLAVYEALGLSGTPLRICASLAPALSLGALLGLALEQRALFEPLWALFGKFPALCASGLALALAWLIGSGAGAPLWLDLAFTALVASALLAPTSWLGRTCSAPALREMGRVSYGIYLFHVPLLGLLRRLSPWLAERPGVLFVLALGLSLAAAELSYRYVEWPLLQLARRRFSVRLDRPDSRPVLAWSSTDSRRLGT